MITKGDYHSVVEQNALRLQQSPGEFVWWLNRISALMPKIGIEVGFFQGGSAFVTVELVKTLEHLVCVDINPRAPFSEVPKVQGVKGNSKDPATWERVKKILAALGYQKFDFAFIDGFHGAEGACADFYSLHPLVRQDGLIGFHDIFMGADPNNKSQPSKAGSAQLWAYLKAAYPSTTTELGLAPLRSRKPGAPKRLQKGIGILQV